MRSIVSSVAAVPTPSARATRSCAGSRLMSWVVPIAVSRPPTVCTSQRSVFGPYTASKVRMLTSGHRPPTTLKTPWAWAIRRMPNLLDAVVATPIPALAIGSRPGGASWRSVFGGRPQVAVPRASQSVPPGPEGVEARELHAGHRPLCRNPASSRPFGRGSRQEGVARHRRRPLVEQALGTTQVEVREHVAEVERPFPGGQGVEIQKSQLRADEHLLVM